MAQLKNILTVSVPSIGKLPLADDPGTFMPSGSKRDHKAGRQAADGGWTESALPAKLDLNLRLQPGLDEEAINAISNEDVTIRFSDGSVHMMSQACVTESLSIGNGDGKVTFISNTSERIV